MNPKLLIGIGFAVVFTVSVIAICKAIENANNLKALEGQRYNDTACLALACNQLNDRIDDQDNNIENLNNQLMFSKPQEGNPGRIEVKGYRR